MWQEAELFFESYIPNEITLGMFFFNNLNELFVTTKNVENTEEFLQDNGHPLKIYIQTELDDDKLIKEELHLNTVFDFEQLDYYNTTSLKELNIILKEFEGVFEVLLNEECTELEKVDNKFIIRFLTE